MEQGEGLFNSELNAEAIFSRAARGDGFSEISRMYFSRITERYLKYFLDREASTKLTNIQDRKRFSDEITTYINAISKHAFETSKITQSYSAGWFNKYANENFPQKRQIRNFLSYAFGKMKSELLREETR